MPGGRKGGGGRGARSASSASPRDAREVVRVLKEGGGPPENAPNAISPSSHARANASNVPSKPPSSTSCGRTPRVGERRAGEMGGGGERNAERARRAGRTEARPRETRARARARLPRLVREVVVERDERVAPVAHEVDVLRAVAARHHLPAAVRVEHAAADRFEVGPVRLGDGRAAAAAAARVVVGPRPVALEEGDVLGDVRERRAARDELVHDVLRPRRA